MSARYPAADVSSERKQESGLSLATLAIASASSVAAAILVSRLWGAGTLIGAAATPVIVALVTEGLHRPARVVSSTVRETRASRFDPVAEGRRGLHEGDLERARPARAGAPAPARARQERPARAASSRSSAIVRRRRLLLAVATGLVAFVIGGVVLTGTELVFGDSAVSGASKRTTFLGGSASRKDTKSTTSTEEKTTPTTSTSTTETTTTDTESQPGVVPTTTTPPPAAGTTTTQPGVAPPTTAAPGGTPAPPTTAPAAPPATTTP